MDHQGHVLVIGASNLDIIGRPDAALVRGSSTSGRIRRSLGGVARNIAENLVRLDVPTVLLTAVGDDAGGEQILGQAASIGIDVSEALIVDGARTGAYAALLSEKGAVEIAVDDMQIMERLTPGYVKARRHLFEKASMVVIDANLRHDTLHAIMTECRSFDVPICADPTSAPLAERLGPHLSNFYMISPDVPETTVLSGEQFEGSDRESAQRAARRLVMMGVEIAVITLGEHGVVYADTETQGYVPAIQTEIVDRTGAGDAMTAAIIFGMLENIPLDESVRLGVSAATLTLRSAETVRSDLSVERLYDELVI